MEPEQNAPVLDVRVGGFRMTVQRVPVRLLTALITCAGSAITAWITAR